MYWYVKYPLIVLALLLGGFVCFKLGGRFITSRRAASVSAPQVAVAPEKEKAADLPTDLPPPPPVEKIADDIAQGKMPAVPAPKELIPLETEKVLRALKSKISNAPLTARQEAKKILDKSKPFSKEWIAAAEIVSESNRIFMNDTAPSPEKKIYVVKSGDSLDRIARSHGTTIAALQRLNRLNPTSSVIHPGQKLRYIEGPWSIRVSKSQFVLVLYRNKEVYRIYRVSTGKQDRTPCGTFVIINKTMYPSWTAGPGRVIPYGDPKNILGTRWMGLQAAGDTVTDVEGLGIHGTTEPESIGTASSLGCIRLLNTDVDELFDFIPEPRETAEYVSVEILE